MDTVKEILKSNVKPKEKISLLADKAKEDKNILAEIVEYSGKCTNAEKGNCIEVMEYVSKDKPELVIPYFNFIKENIDFNAPKVKWECARVIGNLAAKYPEKSAKAVEKLLVNTEDKGTIVRWSAAFALTEIARSNPKLQKKLVEKFKEILEKEANNGVKNVYIKALKRIKNQ
ncbi:HEAT repeat domain-containing protein [candidate division WOR-3 bacterium]|nr:HEAT repeat domain-containing protein [candidate division WOR-3 bacterium]